MITVDDLCNKLLEISTLGRHLIAIAGPPAAGKSTLSDAVCDRLNNDSPNLAAILPMDGFHFDNSILQQRGVLNRKGAPSTFDVGGMKSILQRLKINDESEIAVPVFDRVAEISRGSARIISSNTPIILVEGNYLLLNEKPWNILWNYFNFTVMISTPLDEIKSQLMNRWLELGFSFEEATIRVQENDLKNIQTVIQKSRKADFIIHRGKR